MKVSVVIVTYNYEGYIRPCLDSLRQQTAGLEIIAVDNASSDQTVGIIKSDYPEVRVIQNTENRGFASANNQGFEVAKGEYILVLNADTEMQDPATISELVGYLEGNPDVAVVAPRLVETDGRVQQSAGWREVGLLPLTFEYTLLNRVLYKLLPTVRYPGKLLLTQPELKKRQRVGDLLGAFLLFSRKLLDELGGLDERFFLFLEETDFNLRTRQAGHELHYLPEFSVLHHWGATIDSSGSQQRRYNYYFPSLYLFLGKHHSRPYVWAAKLLAVLGSLLAGLVVAVLWLPAALLGLLLQKPLAKSLSRQLKIIGPVLSWHLGVRRS
jgi:GT2 family glycosyltransferase